MRLRLAVLVVLSLLSTTYGTSRGQQSGAVPVGTVAAASRPITQSTDFVGRVEAKERVDIRARVTGFVQAVSFNEGDYVKEGQVLYEIEPDSFKAAEMHARGALLQAQARFANATAQRV
jgi:membrane fusion protein, multidrug efflux system